MSDPGGQITNLGVLYQGRIAALYLGRMLDPRAVNLPPDQQVIEVRSEKPGAEVDDVFVRFADGHCRYIQAKTALQDSGKTWEKLWEHFYIQHLRDDFGAGDRIELLMGDYAKWYKDLKTITRKASSSTSLEEWQDRLSSKAQKDLAKKLALLLNNVAQPKEEGDELSPDDPVPGPEDYQRLKDLLNCVDLRHIENETIESDLLIYWMPESSVNLETLFNHLFTLVVGYASEGRSFQLDELHKELDRLGVEIKPLEQQSELLPELPDQDELPEPQVELPTGSHLPFHRNHAFTGRHPDLEAIAAVLFYHAPGEPRRIALVGSGGTGKSQLAVEFCYRYGRFTHGVHWLDATQSIDSQVAASGEKMKLPGWENLQLKEQVQLTLQTWQVHPERLIVLDNLDEPPEMYKWLEVLKPYPLLVTSRRDDYEPETGISLHRVQTLPRQQSRELLRTLAKRLKKESDQILDELCDQLGDLPLALDLAGRYLAREGIDIPDYMEELEEVESLLGHESFISEELNRTTAHVRSLAATFAYPWKYLQTEDEYDTLARSLFLAGGYCAPNTPIPAALLITFLELDGKKGQRKLKRAVNRIYRLGLLL